jgi:hypothetical protein
MEDFTTSIDANIDKTSDINRPVLVSVKIFVQASISTLRRHIRHFVWTLVVAVIAVTTINSTVSKL